MTIKNAKLFLLAFWEHFMSHFYESDSKYFDHNYADVKERVFLTSRLLSIYHSWSCLLGCRSLEVSCESWRKISWCHWDGYFASKRTGKSIFVFVIFNRFLFVNAKKIVTKIFNALKGELLGKFIMILSRVSKGLMGIPIVLRYCFSVDPILLSPSLKVAWQLSLQNVWVAKTTLQVWVNDRGNFCAMPMVDFCLMSWIFFRLLMWCNLGGSQTMFKQQEISHSCPELFVLW